MPTEESEMATGHYTRDTMHWLGMFWMHQRDKQAAGNVHSMSPFL